MITQKKKESNRRWYLNKKEKFGIKDRPSKISYEERKRRKKEISKRYREKNAEKLAEAKKNYYENNKDKYKKYNENRSEYMATYSRNRRRNDNLFKLIINIRHSINESIKRVGHLKKSSTQEILGCSFKEFKLYLESKFEYWMSWENHGKYNGRLNYGWDIDHIIPLSSAETEEEILKLNHYTNLQPLCSYINRYIKKDNIYF